MLLKLSFLSVSSVDFFICIIVLVFIWQSPDELIEMAHKYYADTALPKLVSTQQPIHSLAEVFES